MERAENDMVKWATNNLASAVTKVTLFRQRAENAASAAARAAANDDAMADGDDALLALAEEEHLTCMTEYMAMGYVSCGLNLYQGLLRGSVLLYF